MAHVVNKRMEIYPTPELRRAIDRWRGQQEIVLPRAEAARTLIQEALAAHGLTVGAVPTPAKAAPKRKAAPK